MQQYKKLINDNEIKPSLKNQIKEKFKLDNKLLKLQYEDDITLKQDLHNKFEKDLKTLNEFHNLYGLTFIDKLLKNVAQFRQYFKNTNRFKQKIINMPKSIHAFY